LKNQQVGIGSGNVNPLTLIFSEITRCSFPVFKADEKASNQECPAKPNPCQLSFHYFMEVIWMKAIWWAVAEIPLAVSYSGN